MSTVLRDTFRSRGDSTNLYLSRTFSNTHSQPKNTTPDLFQVPNRKLLDFIILAATLFEPTVYLIDGIINDKTQKIISAGIGYVIFILVGITYFLFKNKTIDGDLKLQSLASLILLGTWATSLLKLYADSYMNMLLFFPVLIFKVILFIHYAASLILATAMVGTMMVAGIILHAMHSNEESVFGYIDGIVFFLFLIPFLLSYQKARKRADEDNPKSTDSQTDEKYFSLFGVLEEAVVIVNEQGHLVYFNNPFEKMFSLQKNDENRDSGRDRSKNFVITEFQKITAVKAKDPELQNKIADILRNDQTTTPRVSDSVTRRILRYEESPDSLLISDRESSLSTLYLTFLNSERALRSNSIGFDAQTRLPKFESFSAIMKKSPKENFEIDFNMAYIELGAKVYLCVVFHFNHFQHELKEALREAEFRKQMLRYVAHDMRNPLGSNQLLLEAAESDPHVLPEQKEMYIKPCLKSLKYLLSLVNDLVDAAQLAAGKFKLIINEAYLNDIVDDVIKIFEIKAKSKDITLAKVLDPRLPLTIFTDPARLAQVLINLVSNALKYSPRKGVITIKADLNILNSNKVDFSVEDTGLGIRLEDQKDLLKDFGKVEGSKDPELNPYGVGLGLSISHKLAIQLNVDGLQEGIRIDSVLGRGTKMKFSVENRRNDNLLKVPFGILNMQKKLSENYSVSIEENPVASPCYAQSLSNSIGFEAQRAKKTLTLLRKINEQDVLSRSRPVYGKAFIIDDDAFSAESLATLLRSLGVSADKAYSTKEALKKFEGMANSGSGAGLLTGYDLIFMDGMMEDMNGFESTAILREKMKNDEIKEAPIVFCTGLDNESEPEARKAGASFYLTKPISKSALMGILRKANIGTMIKSS